MLRFTLSELQKNIQYIQAQAEKEPILIEHGQHEQVLLNYATYQHLLASKVQENDSSPNAYDVFADVSPELADALEGIEIEFDLSFSQES